MERKGDWKKVSQTNVISYPVAEIVNKTGIELVVTYEWSYYKNRDREGRMTCHP